MSTNKKYKKVGRPSLKSGEKKVNPCRSVRLSDSERERVDDFCKKHNITFSTLVNASLNLALDFYEAMYEEK